MKVALVHDFLVEFGGAERVLEALCEIYPKAPIYTAFYKKGSTAYKRFKDKKIIASWAQNVPLFASRLHSPLRFLAPLIWGRFSTKGPSFGWDFSGFDLVITSASWYVTKGVKRRGPSTHSVNSGSSTCSARSGSQHTVEVCYCHTPPRYLYGYRTSVDYKKNPLIQAYAVFINHFVRMYDYEAAQRVDYFIANSEEVKRRIQKFYRRESKVIYPPVDVRRFARKTQNAKRLKQKKALDISHSSLSNYFLTVSRLAGAKNIDLIVEVCKNLKLPLKVVGTGRDEAKLREMAEGSAVKILGEVADQELIELYQNCRAVIFAASEEDFGIVPVEAMAAGKPVIALAQGGVLETVVDGKTGVYFDQATAGSLTQAINNFQKLEKKEAFDSKLIKAHAQKFSKERFKREIEKFVEGKIK